MIHPADHPPLLQRLSPNERERLLHDANPLVLKRGEHLYSQGDPPTALFIVRRGRIRVFYSSEEGNLLTFAYWSEGTLVGTPAIYPSFDHQWNAVAAVDSELLAISRERFLALLHDMPALAIGVIEALEFKAKRLGNLAQILATSPVPRRLQLLLVNLLELYGEPRATGAILSVPFTHEEIAGMVGASRPWVSTMMAKLKQLDVVRSEGRLIAIPNVSQLKALDFASLSRPLL